MTTPKWHVVSSLFGFIATAAGAVAGQAVEGMLTEHAVEPAGWQQAAQGAGWSAATDRHLAAGPAGGSTLPPGEYRCYTYHPKPVLAGSFTIAGASYRTRTGAAGNYGLGAGGRIEWQGPPPLGFAVGVLEETQPRATIRLYLQAADVGNKWKAAVCSGPEGSAGADPATPADGAHAAGSKVEMTFAGYWYAATVIRCSGAKCLLRYDDPKWKDEWVETSRIRAR